MTNSPERGSVQYINPDSMITNPAFTQVIAVTGPMKTVYVGAQTAVDASGAIVRERRHRGANGTDPKERPNVSRSRWSQAGASRPMEYLHKGNPFNRPLKWASAGGAVD